MEPDELIEYLRDSVRKCFPPTVKIDVREAQSGVRGVIARVRVDAWVDADRLLYDQSELLRLLDAESIEADAEYAFIAGIFRGRLFELRLFAEPRVVAAAKVGRAALRCLSFSP